MSSDTASSPPLTGSSTMSTVLLAISAFVIVTTEFVMVGLLPALSRDLGISVSSAGQLITLFAFTVMVFGPVLTGLVSHLERKRLFIFILLLFAVANALSAMATNIWVLAVGRILPALALPVFWGTASETVAMIAGPQRAGKAVARVYLGISGAMVLGIPLGTLVAEPLGWRGAFWGLAGLSLVMAVLLARVMPTLARPERRRLMDQASILKEPAFVANIILSVIVFTAMFTAYTYLADMLESLGHVASENVGWWLMGFGVMGLLGNWLGGHLVERSALGATALCTLILALAMVATGLLASSHVLLAIAIVFWGIANTALYPICQVRVMQAATHAQALAGTLNVSMANAGIGLGAIIGGVVIEQWGVAFVGYIAAAIAVLALLMILFITRSRALSGQS